MSNIINRLPTPHESPTSPINQEEPILIPVNQKDFEPNFKSILEPLLVPKKKMLLLHSKSIKGINLKSLLLNNFSNIKEESLTQHDSFPNNATKRELQNFLRKPEIKIGIFQTKLVTGIEGSNVLYFPDAGKTINTSQV